MKQDSQEITSEKLTSDTLKMTWETPELLELDFQKTESGSGAFPEGTVGAIFSGSMS